MTLKIAYVETYEKFQVRKCEDNDKSRIQYFRDMSNAA